MLHQLQRHLCDHATVPTLLVTMPILLKLSPQKAVRKKSKETKELSGSNLNWLGLEIRSTSEGCEEDETGTVEFVARYKVGNKTGMHHERSNFRREEGRWVCIGGKINPKKEPRIIAKVARNEPCPCESGKKFKKCCGR